jgi:hypothetical protein
MAVWRSLVRRFDAALLRHFALAVLACARFWFQLWFRLRRARLIGEDRFRTELGRAARLHRLAARAMTVWLRLTRAR